MYVTRCDCCHRDVEPYKGVRFGLRKHYVRATFEDVGGKVWSYDLCPRCAKFVEDTIKAGVKPEWLGIKPKEG